MKNNSAGKLWPFTSRASLVASILSFIVLLVITVILKTVFHFLTMVADGTLLAGILFISLLPIILCLIDNFLSQGGSIEYKGIKINFAQVPQLTSIGFTVPINFGIPGQPVYDSGSTAIIAALKDATSCNVVIIDLKEGSAWWETRLLVLLAGATRRGRPAKIVFVGTDYNSPECFLGWAHATDLLNELLSKNSQYRWSYHAALAAASQWQLIEPPIPRAPSDPIAPVANIVPIFIQPGLATRFSNKAFTPQGEPAEFFPEELLAADLWDKIENHPGGQKPITLTRLEELFRSILRRQAIDLCWTAERQSDTYFESDDDFIVVTENKRYKTMVSKVAILHTLVKEMVKNK